MMSSEDNLLEIKDLSVKYRTPAGEINALTDINLAIKKGEVIGVVGESGSGKSTLAYSVIRLLPDNAKISGGIVFDGEDLTKKKEKELRMIRGKEISMVFQDPMTSLNPLFSVKEQFLRVLKTHNKMETKEGIDTSISLLKGVEMADPPGVLNSFPFELSGGMQQRVMIAMALSSNPELIIADEPTTAVDATIQSQILELLRKINKSRGLTILLITHNLGIVSQSCDRVVIMYAGKIVESGPVKDIFKDPMHPYTVALLLSVPTLANVNKKEELHTISGGVPNLLEVPKGCPFAPRCDKVMDMCHTTEPKYVELKDGHFLSCHLYNDVMPHE